MEDKPTLKMPGTSSKIEDKPTIKMPGASSRSEVQRWYADLPTAPFPSHRSSTAKKTLKSPTRIALVIFLVLLVLGGGGMAFAYYTYYVPLQQFVRPVTRGANELPVNSAPVYDVIKGKAWNILLLGSDNDQKYVFPSVFTEVMMVVRVDTFTNQVSLVSLPRDSWVWVPEANGMYKIENAFYLGASKSGKFEDGVRLARLTVEQGYGIPIDRYAWVGLEGFAKVIDTLGGIDIDVSHPIVDDNFPDDTGHTADNHNAYKRIYLAPGPQHLNGQAALEYVRSRHGDLVGDIGRTQRQQHILEALKQKLSVNNVVANLPQLLQALNGNVYTDLNQQEMLAFANYGRTLDTSIMQRVTLGPGEGEQNYGTFARVYGQDVIIPNCITIQPTINHIFNLGNTQSCNVTGPYT